MVSRSGLASDQVLIAAPLINRGANTGINTTVPTATIGIRAPAKPMSPRAFPTICWRKNFGDQIAKSRPQHPAPDEDQRYGFFVPQRYDNISHLDFEAHSRQVR